MRTFQTSDLFTQMTDLGGSRHLRNSQGEHCAFVPAHLAPNRSLNRLFALWLAEDPIDKRAEFQIVAGPTKSRGSHKVLELCECPMRRGGSTFGKSEIGFQDDLDPDLFLRLQCRAPIGQRAKLSDRAAHQVTRILSDDRVKCAIDQRVFRTGCTLVRNDYDVMRKLYFPDCGKRCARL